jgi:hypothetical protein
VKFLNFLNKKSTRTIKVKSCAGIPQNYTGIVVWPNGEKQWWLNGKCHREEGPAVVCPNGEKQWWLNGLIHRENGPAMVWANGREYWFLNGKEVDKKTVELYYMLKYKKVLDL